VLKVVELRFASVESVGLDKNVAQSAASAAQRVVCELGGSALIALAMSSTDEAEAASGTHALKKKTVAPRAPAIFLHKYGRTLMGYSLSCNLLSTKRLVHKFIPSEIQGRTLKSQFLRFDPLVSR